jgi:superoxide dismutase, Cu-Zn family
MRLRTAVSLSFVFTLTAYAGWRASVEVHLQDKSGRDVGVATVGEIDSRLGMELDLKGLPAGQHAIHIHQGSTCDGPDFKSAGGPLNPAGKQHGFLNPAGHHAGDFSDSITIRPDGTGHALLWSSDLSLSKPENTVMGHTIVIHAQVDDQKTEPSGNSGDRIACGVIPNLRHQN